jgi:hypothetical protein
VVRLGDRALVAGTQSAVAAAVRAGASGEGIRQDAAFASLLDGLEPTTSKAVLLDAARIAETVAGTAGGHDAEEARIIAALVEGLKVSAVTEEGPTRFGARIEATGLPNVPKLVKTMTPVMMGRASAVRVRVERAARDARERAREETAEEAAAGP